MNLLCLVLIIKYINSFIRIGYLQSNIVSPFSMHQQQLAMLAQQQSVLMAAAAKSTGVDLKYPTGMQQPSPNVSVQNWPSTGFPISGVAPIGVQGELQNHMQVNDSSKRNLYC